MDLEWERRLSAIFVATPVYGTRSSTVLLWDKDGTLTFVERTYGPGGRPLETRIYRVKCPAD
nr:NRDE family protein [Rhodothermus marinus]